MTTGKYPSVLRVVIGADALLSEALERLVTAESDMVCVATVGDAASLPRSVAKCRPEIILVDLSWGEPAVKAVDWVMEHQPTPVVALDCLARTPSTVARAQTVLDQGAVSVHQAVDASSLESEAGRSLLRDLRAAARVPMVRRRINGGGRSTPEWTAQKPVRESDRVQVAAASGRNTAELLVQPRAVSLIAVGASTGGPPCIREVLAGMHAKSPPALVVQHMPADFMSGFAEWLAPLLRVPVLVAAHGQKPLPGHVYVAPGGRHLTLGAGGRLEVRDGPLVSYQRPAVDVLFESIAEKAQGVAAGVLLTGMGEDGARGLSAMRTKGHLTVAQDEASSLVFGMPGAAIALGAAQHIAAPAAIAEALSRLFFLDEATASKARNS